MLSKSTSSTKPKSVKRASSKSLSSTQEFPTPTYGGWTGNKSESRNSTLEINLAPKPTLQTEGSKLIVDKEEFDLDSLRNAKSYDELKSLCNDLMKKYLLKETIKESERQQLLQKATTLAEKHRLQNILDIERAHARKKLLELNSKLDEIKLSKKLEENGKINV